MTGREVYPTYANTGLFGTPAIFDPVNTSPDIKLSALFASYRGMVNYNTLDIFNIMEKTIKKLANFYRTSGGQSEDDALNKAVNVFAGQYDMIFYQGKIIRLPRGRVDLSNVIHLLNITPSALKEIDWRYPKWNRDAQKAQKADDLDYLNNYILRGYWHTDPINQGLVWINASGFADKMKNGRLLYISFNSINKLTSNELYGFLIDLSKEQTSSIEKYIVNSSVGWLNIPEQNENSVPYPTS